MKNLVTQLWTQRLWQLNIKHITITFSTAPTWRLQRVCFFAIYPVRRAMFVARTAMGRSWTSWWTRGLPWLYLTPSSIPLPFISASETSFSFTNTSTSFLAYLNIAIQIDTIYPIGYELFHQSKMCHCTVSSTNPLYLISFKFNLKPHSIAWWSSDHHTTPYNYKTPPILIYACV